MQLYRRRELWVRAVNTPLRFVTSRMPVRRVPLVLRHGAGAHGAGAARGAIPRGSSPIREANRRERAVFLFDHLSPRYQYRYTAEQVKDRFTAAGLRDVKDVTFENEARHMVAFLGVKPTAEVGSPAHAARARDVSTR